MSTATNPDPDVFDKSKPCTTIAAVRHFFGMTNAQMMSEWKVLDPVDREWFKNQLRDQGYQIAIAAGTGT